jgi:DNA-binding NarL/FixJ family response regulator
MTRTDSSGNAAAAADTRRVCRIVLVDGQQIFRQALRVLMAKEADFAVVGDAGQPTEALELIGAARPDVVVTDLQLTDGRGVELVTQIRARFPEMAILVLTAQRSHDAAAAVGRAGALGYVLKDLGRRELVRALRTVAAGRRYRCSVPPAQLARAPLNGDNCPGSRALYLTERQRQVLRSIALGYRTREIARMLGVSVRAVHKQRERLRTALQLDNTAALTRFAVREGLTGDSPTVA